jgi:hypothetical protein
MISNIHLKQLELKLEKYIKQAYSDWEYLRCYNLLNLLLKVNPKNKILIRYVNKIDEKQLEKARERWALWWSRFILFLKNPTLYISIWLLYLLWKIK